ncbi:hypothetical protein MTES_0853 [Microbacterium testaceum StLB037]|uniref:Uncharacterized protein n=1 Tax=Microbacterium testaceum (strain StLB037) TaxID=979556 RepID=E8NEF1_MICTS|nr:hypothetical protein MTES_0853 [Microbacterium testaceum StLB037]
MTLSFSVETVSQRGVQKRLERREAREAEGEVSRSISIGCLQLSDRRPLRLGLREGRAGDSRDERAVTIIEVTRG